MNSSVDQTISRLKSIVGASNNAELARKLGLDQSTISSWRARGKVPKRFLDFEKSKGDLVGHSDPNVWLELNETGQAIALARFAMMWGDLAKSGEVDQAIQTFRDLKSFWAMMHRAIHELRLKMKSADIDLKTAQAIILHDDLRDPPATLERISAQLAEEIADNPSIDFAAPLPETGN